MNVNNIKLSFYSLTRITGCSDVLMSRTVLLQMRSLTGKQKKTSYLSWRALP